VEGLDQNCLVFIPKNDCCCPHGGLPPIYKRIGALVLCEAGFDASPVVRIVRFSGEALSSSVVLIRHEQLEITRVGGSD
jgi:hypothetical protein